MKQIVNRVLIATLLVSFVLVPARTAGAQVGVTDDEIREILRDRIDVAKKSVGIVVGLVDDQGIRIVSYGKSNQNSDQMVNADSVFEIGSVTKVFTATLLADMVERGAVTLNDPISKYLPKSVKTPTRAGKEITLLHPLILRACRDYLETSHPRILRIPTPITRSSKCMRLSRAAL